MASGSRAATVAQAKAGYLGRAVETALSIEHLVQYENDALLEIVKIQIMTSI